jgi:hypothetical protein
LGTSFIEVDSDADGDDLSLRDNLSRWATDYKISHAALSSLLLLLQPFHPDLPKVAKTLLCTKGQVDIQTAAGVEYYYFGLAYWLVRLLDNGSFQYVGEQLTIYVNIDGVSLFNSSNTSLWPILCSVRELDGSLFPAAIYCSSNKPNSINEYLNDFITEMHSLEHVGLTHNEKHYSVCLGALVM